MHKPTQLFLILNMIILLGFSSCAAEDAFLQTPTVEYSADEIMEASGMTMLSKVFYSKGKIRKEQNVQGNKSIMIIRPDEEMMIMLMPDQRMYMEMEAPKDKGLEEDVSGDFTKNMVAQKNLGKETLNGIKTTKRQVIIENPEGGYTGLIWQSKEGIMVKMEMTPENKDAGTFTLELKNIRQEPQDPALFEIPQGYTKMGMPSLGGLGGLLKGFMD